MGMQETKKLVESRDMVYKGDIVEKLTEEEFKSGVRKINLQPIDNLDSLNGEGCWAWMSKENIEKYENNNSQDTIDVILTNMPLEYMGILFWGSEIRVKCNKESRPTLDKEWVKEKILNSKWYKDLE